MILFLSFKVKAQQRLSDPAYIITIQNDTIAGFVNEALLFNSSTIFIQRNKESRLVNTFQLHEIKKLTVSSNKIFFPREMVIDGKSVLVLMRLIMKGKVRVLYTRLKKKKRTYFWEKDEVLKEADSEFFGRSAYAYFYDCPSLLDDYPELVSMNFSYEKLIELTSKYNQCIDENENIIIYLPPEKRGPFYGFRLAAASNHVALDEISYYSELDARSTYPGAGIFFGFQANNNLLFKTELSLLQKGAKDTQVNVPPLNRRNIVSDFDFDLTYIELSMLFQYNFGNGLLNGYLIMGPSISYSLFPEVTELKYSNNGLVQGLPTVPSSKVLLGVYGGGGISYSINNQYDMFLEGRYGGSLDKLESSILTWDMVLTTFQLGVGILRRI